MSIPVLDGSGITERELIRRVVTHAKPITGKQKGIPRWSYVMEQFALGSTFATILCHDLALNPDEIVRKP